MKAGRVVVDVVEGNGILPRSKMCHLYCVILLSWNTTDFVVIIQDLQI